MPKNVHNRYKDYLCHHGILGMKWGIRRFQNKDGSLTSAGKKRYNQEPTQQIDDFNSRHEFSEAISKKLSDSGFHKDADGSYVKEFKTGKGINAVIEVDNDGFKSRLSDDEFGKLIDHVNNDFDALDKKCRKSIIDAIMNDPDMLDKNILDESFKNSSQVREYLEEHMGEFVTSWGSSPTYPRSEWEYRPGSMHFRIMSDGLGSVGYDDGGLYGDHYLNTDIDWRTMKIGKYIATDG